MSIRPIQKLTSGPGWMFSTNAPSEARYILVNGLLSPVRARSVVKIWSWATDTAFAAPAPFGPLLLHVTCSFNWFCQLFVGDELQFAYRAAERPTLPKLH